MTLTSICILLVNITTIFIDIILVCLDYLFYLCSRIVSFKTNYSTYVLELYHLRQICADLSSSAQESVFNLSSFVDFLSLICQVLSFISQVLWTFCL